MPIIKRIARHLSMFARAKVHTRRRTPPFLVIFVNSICNLSCEHCFYWKNLNQRDDLRFEEFERLSRELGDFENLNLSGGEPFQHQQLADIVQLFIDNNHVKEIYIPTNGYFTDRTERQVRQMLQSDQLGLLVCEISLDGTEQFHNTFRGNNKSFQQAMQTYDVLASIQADDPRLRIHCISTATADNMDELEELTDFLYQRCPKMDHHSLAIIQGDRKNPLLKAPSLSRYEALYRHIAARWRQRESERYGSSVEPMLQWAKLRTLEEDRQFIACTAGNMSGVIYANGDVSVCETHKPLGNLRERSFFEIWDSAEAGQLRTDIGKRKCHCTKEVYMWPGIVYQPLELSRAMLAAWRKWQS